MHSLTACLMAARVAPAPGPPRNEYTLQQYMAIKRSNEPTFSPEADRIAFASNASGDWQLWVTPLSQWQSKQVSHFAGGFSARWGPKGNAVLAMVDRNGDQKFQLLTIDSQTGETTLVTHEPEASHRLGGWMPDGRS